MRDDLWYRVDSACELVMIHDELLTVCSFIVDSVDIDSVDIKKALFLFFMF